MLFTFDPARPNAEVHFPLFDEEALPLYKRVLDDNPYHFFDAVSVTACYSYLWIEEQGRAIAKEVLGLDPDSSVKQYVEGVIGERSRRKRCINALRVHGTCGR
ncbi:MAG: hypothetical protein GTO12_26870 [Proteobacteria bacterium]|nr:hypothetical protein [Pseudomonadota bacterium]